MCTVDNKVTGSMVNFGNYIVIDTNKIKENCQKSFSDLAIRIDELRTEFDDLKRGNQDHWDQVERKVVIPISNCNNVILAPRGFEEGRQDGRPHAASKRVLPEGSGYLQYSFREK